MDERTVIVLYAKFYDLVKRLGNLPWENPTIDTLFEGRKSLMQYAYKQMKEDKFPGSVIDYVGWISTQFFLHQIRIQNPQRFSLLEIPTLLVENFSFYLEEVKNCLRLFRSISYDKWDILQEFAGDSIDLETKVQFAMAIGAIQCFIKEDPPLIGRNLLEGHADCMEN